MMFAHGEDVLVILRGRKIPIAADMAAGMGILRLRGFRTRREIRYAQHDNP